MTAQNSINNTLQTPFTLGATSVTSTGTQLNLLNASTVVPFTKINVQTFASSGTYTPTSGMVYCIIECVGPGGAGGGCASSSAIGSGGGGGGGGYSRKFATAATIGASQTVTVGTGGTPGTAGNNAGGNGSGSTSVGAVCTAGAGQGGSGAAANSTGGGGSAGTAGTGDIAVAGNIGGTGIGGTITTLAGFSGQGATGPWGGAPSVRNINSPGNGFSGNGPGAGGSGGLDSSSGGNRQGGSGSNGFVVVTEFINA